MYSDKHTNKYIVYIATFPTEETFVQDFSEMENLEECFLDIVLSTR